MLFKNSKYCFTLAEVLITLVIIGVVAAMTIPLLINTINDKVSENQIKVFTSKLQQGMDTMNLAGEIGPYYNTTEDFVKALSAHMKIVTICDKDNLQNCLPIEEIQVDGEEEPLKLSDIKSGENFGLDKENYPDVAGMVLGDGTPMLLSWNKNCPVSDPDSSSRGGNLINSPVSNISCIKGIYDLNGAKGPNRFAVIINGKNTNKGDIRSFNGATLAKTESISSDYVRLPIAECCSRVGKTYLEGCNMPLGDGMVCICKGSECILYKGYEMYQHLNDCDEFACSYDWNVPQEVFETDICPESGTAPDDCCGVRSKFINSSFKCICHGKDNCSFE